MMLRTRTPLLWLSLLTICSCAAEPSSQGEESIEQPDRGPPVTEPPVLTTPPTASSSSDAPPPMVVVPFSITTRVLHREHRAIPNVMFGGWGPHLGHLMRAGGGGGELFFVDDACAPGSCNVNVNQRLDYLRLRLNAKDGASAWERIDSQTLPPTIQQNTASIIARGRVSSYGVDSAAQALVECSRDLATGAKSCGAVSTQIGAFANYVGAAVTPRGYRMAWYTNVKDGGGGSFSFFIDYNSGWNGPRQGTVGGYNDASYVNIAFGVDGNPDRFTMHSELVGGRAPAWTFLAATGEGSVNVATPVTWATSLPKPTGDAVMSSNDVLVDPRTNDTHLVARTKSGSAAYYFRPKGAAEYRGPIEVFAKSGRVRLVSLSDGTVALVRSDDSAVGGVAVHVVPASAITAGTPIAWSKTPAVRPTLPVEYKQIYAIYTESDSYSLAPRSSLEIAIVGQTHENEVLHISIQGLTR